MGSTLQSRAKAAGVDVPTFVYDTWLANDQNTLETARLLHVSVNTVNGHLRNKTGDRRFTGMQLTDAEREQFEAMVAREWPLAVIATELNKSYYALIRWAQRNGWRARMIASEGKRKWIWRRVGR
jgi:hypothetical protein